MLVRGSSFQRKANKAALDSPECCRIIENYCSSEPACYIRTLKSSVRSDWDLLKKALLAVYMSAKEEDRYTYAMLDSFTCAKRNIKNIKAYDKYFRQFMSIVNPLMDKGKLIESQYDELFFKGLRPGSLRLYVQRALQQAQHGLSAISCLFLGGLWLIHDNYPSSIPLFYIVGNTLRNLT
jgi:hypothetical protein